MEFTINIPEVYGYFRFYSAEMKQNHMKSLFLSLIISLFILEGVMGGDLYSAVIINTDTKSGIQDNKDYQVLYNGRIWRNLYSRVKGDQFLFTDAFLPGSVIMSNRLFKDLSLRYDIYNDELLLRTDKDIILQLNKEMVSGFSLEYNKRTYNFEKIEGETALIKGGYYNILYRGRSELLVSYKKEIMLLAVDRKYDLFNQYHRIYLRKDGLIYPIRRKSDLVKIYGVNKKDVKSFIKSRRITVTVKDPDSISLLAEFCDNFPEDEQ
jgi:hypothetical protein